MRKNQNWNQKSEWIIKIVPANNIIELNVLIHGESKLIRDKIGIFKEIRLEIPNLQEKFVKKDKKKLR